MQEVAADKVNEAEDDRLNNSVLRDWIKIIVYAFILALVIWTYILATFLVSTGSMEDTLRPGDRLVALEFIYGFRIPFTERRILALTEPRRGDVIVFGSDGIEKLDKDKNYVKRLIGTGGERLRIAPEKPDLSFGWGGRVHIDGKPIEEPASIAGKIYYPAGEYGKREVVVPAEHFFMLGDNVENSRDSRYWGFVPRENVIGKAVAIYWPPGRAGLIK
jgi:signal peptidase I